MPFEGRPSPDWEAEAKIWADEAETWADDAFEAGAECWTE
jgi:hypothetical protein